MSNSNKLSPRIFSPASGLLLLVKIAVFTGSACLLSFAQQTCHLRELDLCATSLLVFTQSPSGFATNEQEISRQCKHLNESDSCLKNYSKQCMSPVQRELLNFATNTSFTMLEEYCTKGTSLRTDYLKHASCYNKIDKKQSRTCLKDFQAALEILTASGSGDGKRLQLACCSYRRLEGCLGTLIEKKCGKEALSYLDGLVRRVTGKIPETVCRTYKPDGQECRALLPKPGSQPKGSKSSSIVSRLMSAYIGV